MRLTLIGGIDRLEQHYRNEARKRGHELQVFNTFETTIAKRIGATEAVFLFTSQVSHCARSKAVKIARLHGIPVHQIHSCGVCALRECLDCLERAQRA